MGISNWFTFRSREEQRRHERDYMRRVFPLGEGQRQAEEALLAACVSGGTASERMYQLLLAKDALCREDETEEALGKWYNASLLRRYSPQDRAAILAIAQLSMAAQSLEEMPAQEDVFARAAQLTAQLMPSLQKRRGPAAALARIAKGVRG